MVGPVVFAGDPHRNFSPIIRFCLEHPPGILILVGDCDCPAPLSSILAPLIDSGWAVRWILGNHDTETEAAYDHLVTDYPAGDFGLQVIDVAGLRVAGLPGVFKPRVWYPRVDAAGERIEPPRFLNRADFLAVLKPQDQWRGGLPLWHRDTIFPEDLERLGKHRFDVLVSHEAPSSHRHGFDVIDRLAMDAGARLIVHGHHHLSYAARLDSDVRVRVRGLGLAEPWIPECW